MMTRRERLMKTLRGEKVDRPAVSFYEIGGFDVNPKDNDPFNIYNSPDWQPLLQLAEEHTDLIRMRSIPARWAHPEVRSQFFKSHTYEEGKSRFTKTTLTVGGRTMTGVSRRDQGVDTVWEVEHLLKDTDDLAAYLQLPDEVFVRIGDAAPLEVEDTKVGDRGIVMVDTEDPLCAAAALFGMEDFVIIAMTEQEIFHRLLAKFAPHYLNLTQQISKAYPGHLWRIYGPEYATEPYLPPSLFRDYVVTYTGPMVAAIKQHGGFARIHSHGRIRNVLPYIMEMGTDGLDPIEPPPQGNVELAEVRKQYGHQLVLFGNLEATDIENLPAADFEKVVARSLKDGTSGEGRGFVLMPSASPYGPVIGERTMANYKTMVRLATGHSV